MVGLAAYTLALSLPFVVISGTIAADHHAAGPVFRTVYLQKAAFASALLTLGQAFLGHRLTLVAGPAAALLLGILGSRAAPDAVYTAAGLEGASQDRVMLRSARSGAPITAFLSASAPVLPPSSGPLAERRAALQRLWGS